MASSRWKRFAFFERQTLAVPQEVLADVLPRKPQTANAESSAAVHMCVTTAGLPSSVTAVTKKTNKKPPSKDSTDAWDAMWNSLTACHTVEEPHKDSDKNEDTNRTNGTVEFPPKDTTHAAATAVPRPTTALDGLVLAFFSSPQSPYVHCVDVTIRCNPPLTTEPTELEDMDGWRGYVAPLRTTPEGAGNAGAEPLLDIATARVQHAPNHANNIQASAYNPLHLVCLSPRRLVIWEDAHLVLSCQRPLATSGLTQPPKVWQAALQFPATDGTPTVVAAHGAAWVAVGTNAGAVWIWTYNNRTVSSPLRKYLRIPPPPTEGHQVQTIHLTTTSNNKAQVFVTYHRPTIGDTDNGVAAGLCCYEFPLPAAGSNATLTAPSARHDLDGRTVPSARWVDGHNGAVTIARPDGLYTYAATERLAVAPIDGHKIALAVVPAPVPAVPVRSASHINHGYALVAATDEKSGRDAVDIYDATNKLVAFHLLLSPGHKALQAAGVTTVPSLASDGSWKGGRSSALVFTSGGSLVTLTEKLTTEKVELLVQKNLYAAAVVVAYADPAFPATDITNLYRQYAEHLYNKGEFSAAMEQYIHTIGSLESSHIIFRYLDAPKIPLLVRYLEKLREKKLATAVHNDLLRTCYLKLNDTEAAEAIASSASSSRFLDKSSLNNIFSNVSNNPKEALATICTLEAHQAAEVLVIHGASLARAFPRETAGVIISLCVGTYSPRALAGLSASEATDLKKMIEYNVNDNLPRACDPYPVELFASAFLEHPKLLRLILAHCNRNKCALSPSLRRTLLELTLAEWNQAKRTVDTEAQKLRHKEAIAALTDSHCREIGDYDALVIVQLANFPEGELILYERLQMTPMLLERYAREGSEKSRRQMLALCQTDPEVLADVLGHFVALASDKLSQKRLRTGASTKTGESNNSDTANSEDEEEDDEIEEILEDIQEALVLAKRQAVLPPVRIARILAGEGTGQFTDANAMQRSSHQGSIPLSVALDFVGTILEESREEISRLKSEVEDYNELCNSMEIEIDSLLRSSHTLPPTPDGEPNDVMASRLNIDEVYAKLLRAEEGEFGSPEAEPPVEAFWRDLTHADDRFETLTRYFAKGVIQ